MSTAAIEAAIEAVRAAAYKIPRDNRPRIAALRGTREPELSLAAVGFHAIARQVHRAIGPCVIPRIVQAFGVSIPALGDSSQLTWLQALPVEDGPHRDTTGRPLPSQGPHQPIDLRNFTQ